MLSSLSYAPICRINHNFLVDLKSFSAIPPSTDIHKDRQGRFIITAHNASWIPGAQRLTNYFKEHTPENLAKDIDTFAKELITNMHSDVELASLSNDQRLKERVIRQLVLINREISRAVRGVEEGGGLEGLARTHAVLPDVSSSIRSSIQFMQERALAELLTLRACLGIDDYSEDDFVQAVQFKNPKECLPLCPEEKFSDEDWAKAIAASEDLKAEYVSLLKYYGNYRGALLFNNAMSNLDGLKTGIQALLGAEQEPSWNWWDKIQTFNQGQANEASLYLGALPIARGAFGYSTRNDLEGITALGVGAILSVVEVFENNAEGYISAPIKPSEWKAVGIKQLQLPTPDFETMPIEFVQRGVEFIHWNISNGRSVYVHCKAGRGRSALIEMCYLIKYQGLSAEQAFSLVKSQRKQAGFSDSDPKMATLKEFERRCRQTTA